MDAFMNLEALIKEAGLSIPSESTVETRASTATSKKIKFMLVGTHAHQTTGYSKVTYNIIKELAKCPDLELYHFGFQKFMDSPANYRVYPTGVDVYDPFKIEKEKYPNASGPEMGFGFSQLPDYVRKVKPDIIMIYNDASVVCKFLDKLEQNLSAHERKYKLIIYLDQVYTTQRLDLLKRMEKDADVYFAFTSYWKSVLEAQGVKKPIHVLRHGFDSHIFKPLDKVAARKKHNIPDNWFVFLNLNRNTPRKRHDIVVTAFAELVARNPTRSLVLLCVCDGGETGGFPIQEIYIRELERLKAPVQQHLQKLLIASSSLTYTDELINELYTLSDVGISAADGEGFGLCTFEAMGIGIPQVVPDIGGFKDFCKHNENSLVVKPKWRSYIPTAHSPLGGILEIVDAHELSLAAEEYVLDSELREKHGKAARETVLGYKWENEMKTLVDAVRTLIS